MHKKATWALRWVRYGSVHIIVRVTPTGPVRKMWSRVQLMLLVRWILFPFLLCLWQYPITLLTFIRTCHPSHSLKTWCYLCQSVFTHEQNTGTHVEFKFLWAFLPSILSTRSNFAWWNMFVIGPCYERVCTVVHACSVVARNFSSGILITERNRVWWIQQLTKGLQ